LKMEFAATDTHGWERHIPLGIAVGGALNRGISGFWFVEREGLAPRGDGRAARSTNNEQVKLQSHWIEHRPGLAPYCQT
jgi:hypothetical protein